MEWFSNVKDSFERFGQGFRNIFKSLSVMDAYSNGDITFDQIGGSLEDGGTLYVKEDGDRPDYNMSSNDFDAPDVNSPEFDVDDAVSDDKFTFKDLADKVVSSAKSAFNTAKTAVNGIMDYEDAMDDVPSYLGAVDMDKYIQAQKDSYLSFAGEHADKVAKVIDVVDGAYKAVSEKVSDAYEWVSAKFASPDPESSKQNDNVAPRGNEFDDIVANYDGGVSLEEMER
ncbi:hypothetical protein J6A31_04655 [bacterium]|nr:hypothetical protein [bacterium]